MTRTEHLLTILAEELGEAAVRVSKILRFGGREVQPGQSLTNRERLRAEMVDALAVYSMLWHEGELDEIGLFIKNDYPIRAEVEAKKAKVEKFLAYSAQCGTLIEATKNPHGECAACGSPNNADGTCSRSQCYNSD